MNKTKFYQWLLMAGFVTLLSVFLYFIVSSLFASDSGVSGFVIIFFTVGSGILFSFMTLMYKYRPGAVVFVSYYCFFIGLFLMSVSLNTFLINSQMPDQTFWPFVITPLLITSILVFLGVGSLYSKKICWKILFILLIVFVTNSGVILLISGFYFIQDMTGFYRFWHDAHISTVAVLSFISVFVTGIVALYYLAHKDSVAYFGGMGDLLSPF